MDWIDLAGWELSGFGYGPLTHLAVSSAVSVLLLIYDQHKNLPQIHDFVYL